MTPRVAIDVGSLHGPQTGRRPVRRPAAGRAGRARRPAGGAPVRPLLPGRAAPGRPPAALPGRRRAAGLGSVRSGPDADRALAGSRRRPRTELHRAAQRACRRWCPCTTAGSSSSLARSAGPSGTSAPSCGGPCARGVTVHVPSQHTAGQVRELLGRGAGGRRAARLAHRPASRRTRAPRGPGRAALRSGPRRQGAAEEPPPPRRRVRAAAAHAARARPGAPGAGRPRPAGHRRRHRPPASRRSPNGSCSSTT